jgi:hypothetical protein
MTEAQDQLGCAASRSVTIFGSHALIGRAHEIFLS